MLKVVIVQVNFANLVQVNFVKRKLNAHLQWARRSDQNTGLNTDAPEPVQLLA